MARRPGVPLVLLTLCGLGIIASAQPLPIPNPAPIIFGQSVVPLNGPWKFQIGDSPIDPKTGKPLWAEPSFDDSGWESVDLKPPTGEFDPAGSERSGVPGWRAKGHPNYWGWAWYRLDVPLAKETQNLALAGPAYVDGAYQVFSNADLLGGMGAFYPTGGAPTIYWSHPAMFPLPETRTCPDTTVTGRYSRSESGRRNGSTCLMREESAQRLCWARPVRFVQRYDWNGLRASARVGIPSLTGSYCSFLRS